jgi:nucleoside-triphosphatase
MASAHVLLITGRPGSGKTTLLRTVAASLAGWRLRGFYTEEIRARGQRRGFRIVTFDGQTALMAAVDLPKTRRVGRYGVDVAVIDEVADSALTRRAGIDLYLVDEIGKMECLSARFVAAMRALLDSPERVIATVARRGGDFIAEVKQRSDVELWELTSGNRDALADQVRGWVTGRRSSAARSGASPSSRHPGFR